MRIAVTDNMGSEHKYQFYTNWLQRSNVPHEVIKLSYVSDNLAMLGTCDAIVFTGGSDVDPALYNGPVGHSTITGIDPKRDAFEQKALDVALRRQIPVLGICRGMQLVNVHLGGTLLPDIEEAGFPPHRSGGTSECRHPVSVESGSALATVAGTTAGEVNSSHHQAVDRPGLGLRAVARSADGIMEALEMEQPYPFFLCVQWHPERMNDFLNPFSQRILNRFIQSVQTNID